MAASSMAFSLTLFSRLSRNCIPKGISAFKNVSLNGPNLNGCVVYRLHSQWHLVGALCLERKPVVSQELTTPEKEFRLYLDKLEVECSHLSNHELRENEDRERASSQSDEKDLKTFTNTARDDEDAYNEELHKFQLASRTGDPEVENNRKNLKRHLSKSLVLLVKQKLGNNSHWGLPQAVRQEGETMKQVAERVCKEICGGKLNVAFLGNAPIGYCKYKYPKAARKDDILGAKVFFFKAWHLDGNVCESTVKEHPEADDYMWATRSELEELVSPKDYRKTILNFLVEDVPDVDKDAKAVEVQEEEEEDNSQILHEDRNIKRRVQN